MRFSIFSIVLIFSILAASGTTIAGVNWAGPDILSMPRESSIIDQQLSGRLNSIPGEEKQAVWVFFTDKGVFDFGDYANQLAMIENAMPRIARERRSNSRGIYNLVDFRDLPVFPDYVQSILATGVQIRYSLKWFNAVTIQATADQIKQIAEMPFVRHIRSVARRTAYREVEIQPIIPDLNLITLDYGPSQGQMAQINSIAAHELGFKGQDVLICMMDVGYKIGHVAFENIVNSGRMWAQYDFINHDENTDFDPDQDQDGQADHGTLTWSTLGGEASGHLYGPSYMANFILAKTEDISSERHIEEDNWAAAAEWADSIGASVISASLGYRYDFSPGEGDYSYEDMNGDSTIVTIAADLAAYNGIAVATAMGNDGYLGAGSLIAPADGDSVIACGAVNSMGERASFSALGPTFDSRTKPEVCAQGVGTACADPDNLNGYTTASGTSLSTPLVGGACGVLLSAHPGWNPMMVRDALMMTGSKYDTPDNEYGWGIIDVGRALYYHPAGSIVIRHNPVVMMQIDEQPLIHANITVGAVNANLFYRIGDVGDFTSFGMETWDNENFWAYLPGSSGNTIYYYIEGIDGNGAHEYDPVGGPLHPYAVTPGSPSFTDSFENGPSYWEPSGTFSFWGPTAKYARTGNLAITDSPTTDYRDNTNSYLESKFSMSLSSISNLNLTFYWRGVLQSSLDSLYVECSTDGGIEWDRLPQGINGSVFSFTAYNADLSSYAGAFNFRLRFHLVTSGTGRREGVYIDDLTLSWTPSGAEDESNPRPHAFSLEQNYPNPFNPETRIGFTIKENSSVMLKIFDLSGREVKTLLSGQLEGGDHSIIWDGKNSLGQEVASGIYFYKLESDAFSQIKRMTLLR